MAQAIRSGLMMRSLDSMYQIKSSSIIATDVLKKKIHVWQIMVQILIRRARSKNNSN